MNKITSTFSRYIYIILITFTLFVLAVCVGKMYGDRDKKLNFVLGKGDSATEITAFEMEDGKYYVFLPSYASLKNLYVVIPDGSNILIDGEVYLDGTNCGKLEKDTEYRLELNYGSNDTIQFMQSSDVPAMYIDTASGRMDYIHEKKGNEETANISLYSKAGEILLDTEGCSIKGRGNYTWEQEKKPYAVTLTSEADLLGMGQAANWILLSNSTEQTNLRNAIAYDLAREVGLGWVPEYRYVDLYLNGIYYGLYMVTEKIEAAEERLDIDMARGDFLCKIDREEILENLNNPFATNHGRLVEITEPQVLRGDSKSRIEELVNHLEESIYKEENLDDVIDLRSWVRRYLIDEISANIDADIGSSYFYYKHGIFYAGPVWDYDLGFGAKMRNAEPDAFIAKNYVKKENMYSLWYDSLHNNKEFYSQVIDLYQTEFQPLLEELIDKKLEEYQKSIEDASEMNYIRWADMYEMVQWKRMSMEQANAELCDYIKERYSFLNNVWVEGVVYCTVQMKDPAWEGYWSKSIPQGSHLEEAYFDINNISWINEKTGEKFDFNQPIMEDVVLRSEMLSDEEIEEADVTRATQDYITFISIFIGLLVFTCIIILDIRRNKGKGRNA